MNLEKSLIKEMSQTRKERVNLITDELENKFLTWKKVVKYSAYIIGAWTAFYFSFNYLNKGG